MNTLDFGKFFILILMLVIMTTGTLFASENDQFGVRLVIDSENPAKRIDTIGYSSHSDEVFNAQLVSHYNIGTLRTFGMAIFISHATNFSSEIQSVTSINQITDGMMVEVHAKAGKGDYIDATHVHVLPLSKYEAQKKVASLM